MQRDQILKTVKKGVPYWAHLRRDLQGVEVRERCARAGQRLHILRAGKLNRGRRRSGHVGLRQNLVELTRRLCDSSPATENIDRGTCWVLSVGKCRMVFVYAGWKTSPRGAFVSGPSNLVIKHASTLRKTNYTKVTPSISAHCTKGCAGTKYLRHFVPDYTRQG